MNLQSLPNNWPQRQDSIAEQLADLRLIANRLGFYDADDAIGQWAQNPPELRYGCHVDLLYRMRPDDCVIDKGIIDRCIYAKPGMRKEQCPYWRVIVEDA